MSTYYYLANDRNKEYIDCENHCSPKEWALINGKGCQLKIATKLLIHHSWDAITVYDDIYINESPPWNHSDKWQNVWNKDLCRPKDDE